MLAGWRGGRAVAHGLAAPRAWGFLACRAPLTSFPPPVVQVRKLKPRNKSSLLRSPSEFVGKVGLKSMGSDGLAWSFLGLPRCGGPGFELVQLGLPCT